MAALSFNRKKQAAFLAAYMSSATIRHACKACKVSSALHYYWLKRDPTYKDRFREVQILSCNALEEEARRRACEGVKKYKFTSKGEPILHPKTGKPYYEHVYSDTLLIKLLEANHPEKFAKKIETTFNGEINHTSRVIVVLPANGREVATQPVPRDRLLDYLHNGSNGTNGNGAN